MKATTLELRKNLIRSTILLIVSVMLTCGATFAWYIYNTNAHTTRIHMAAGSSVSLEINNSYDETLDSKYGSSTVLESFSGRLTPVSTDKIVDNYGNVLFQKVMAFATGAPGQPSSVARFFGAAEISDFYKTSLFIKSGTEDMKIYVSNIGFSNDNSDQPISTAIRLGLVVHEAGRNQPIAAQYIFAVDEGHNIDSQGVDHREYNTATGQEGYVLDSTKHDGETIPFVPYTRRDFASYNDDTGEVDATGALHIYTLAEANLPVQVDVYIWLEGCDEDCTLSLCEATLKDISISFCGAL